MFTKTWLGLLRTLPSFIDTFKPFPPFSSSEQSSKREFPTVILLPAPGFSPRFDKAPLSLSYDLSPCHLLSWPGSPPLNGALTAGTPKPFVHKDQGSRIKIVDQDFTKLPLPVMISPCHLLARPPLNGALKLKNILAYLKGGRIC